MASDPPPTSSFIDDPPVARILRRVDGVVGIAEQVVLGVLGVFILVVSILWITFDQLGSPLENVVYDVIYATFLMAMIGGAFATHHRRLLAMDVINRMVGARSRAWLRLVTTGFAIFVTAIFFWYSIDVYRIKAAEEASEHWIPDDVGKSAMAVGSALMLFHLVVQVVIDLTYLAAGKTPPEPEMGAV